MEKGDGDGLHPVPSIPVFKLRRRPGGEQSRRFYAPLLAIEAFRDTFQNVIDLGSLGALRRRRVRGREMTWLTATTTVFSYLILPFTFAFRILLIILAPALYLGSYVLAAALLPLRLLAKFEVSSIARYPIYTCESLSNQITDIVYIPRSGCSRWNHHRLDPLFMLHGSHLDSQSLAYTGTRSLRSFGARCSRTEEIGSSLGR
jgi:hypothetical protein